MSLLLDPEARPVVAHRGNSAFAPENTIEALTRAVRVGADAIEFDVHRSRDGHPVVIHDPTVNRTTDGRGAVAALPLAELRRLDAGYRFTRDGGRTFPFRGRGLAIPTLEEALDAAAGTALIVEIKTVGAAEPARRVLERAGVMHRCLVGSFLPRALAPFRGAGFACSASRSDVLRLYARAALPGGPRRLPFHALVIPPVYDAIPLPVLRFARMARRAGIPAHVWTVDDLARARRYWTGGVNGIITNDPAALLATDRLAGGAPGVVRRPSSVVE